MDGEAGKFESEKLPEFPGRILEIVEPTEEDLRRAAHIPADACPRRYCWWWRSLAFEWEIPPFEGCTWLKARKPKHWFFREVPCRRAEPSSNIDHFEPREPHIDADRIDASLWLVERQKNHERYPGDS